MYALLYVNSYFLHYCIFIVYIVYKLLYSYLGGILVVNNSPFYCLHYCLHCLHFLVWFVNNTFFIVYNSAGIVYNFSGIKSLGSVPFKAVSTPL